MFTVHSRGVFTQDKSGYFSNSKVYGKNGTGKKCSLIRGVHYERFHCNLPFLGRLDGNVDKYSLF